MTIEIKLKDIGFEELNYMDEKALVLSVKGLDRFKTDFVYYSDENKIYINRHYLSGLKTISIAEIKENHNNKNSNALETLNMIIKQLDTEVYSFANSKLILKE